MRKYFYLKILLVLFTCLLLNSCKRASHTVNSKRVDSIKIDTIISITVNNVDDTIINNKVYFGQKFAQNYIDKYLQNVKNENYLFNDTKLINDSKTLISVIEPILFKIYGRQNIINQRPYGIYKCNDYWFVIGSLNKGMDGGVFHLGIDSRNCKIVILFHDK